MCGTAEEFLASVLNRLSRWPFRFSARAVYLACLSRKINRNGQKLEKSHDRLPSLWVSLGPGFQPRVPVSLHVVVTPPG